MPAGLLRGMRLRGRSEVWDELVEGHWLRAPDLRSAPMQVQVLDYAVRDQAPGRAARRRAAHWALSPCPLDVRRDTPSTTRLVALALAAHLSPGPAHTADMEELGRLCGHTPHQTAELLDRLVTTGKLAF